MTKQEMALKQYTDNNAESNNAVIDKFSEFLFEAIAAEGQTSFYKLNIDDYDIFPTFDLSVVEEKLKEEYPALTKINIYKKKDIGELDSLIDIFNTKPIHKRFSNFSIGTIIFDFDWE